MFIAFAVLLAASAQPPQAAKNPDACPATKFTLAKPKIVTPPPKAQEKPSARTAEAAPKSEMAKKPEDCLAKEKGTSAH